MTATDSAREKLMARKAELERTEPSEPIDSPAAMVRKAIDTQSSAFAAVLPSHVDTDRFARLVLTAVKATPDLMQCFGTEQGKTSVLLAAMQAAAVGLEPNTPTQDCWLLPRKRNNIWEAQLSLGYRGLLKLVRRSGQIASVHAEVVNERDEFRWSRGLDRDDWCHVPYDGEDDPGPLTHAYAVARFLTGGYQFVVLNRRQVHARRAMSESWKSERSRPYSPWTKWEEAMWRKSALRALVPMLDLNSEDARVVNADEAPELRIDDEGAIDAVWTDDAPALTEGSDSADNPS
jgi:recombination protein RecT